MLKELVISFSDWNATRLKNVAALTLARSRWWSIFAEWLETGEWEDDNADR